MKIEEKDSIIELCGRLFNYKFVDNLGHPLNNCIDFQQIIKKALNYELYYLKTEKVLFMCLDKKNLINKRIEKIENFLKKY